MSGKVRPPSVATSLRSSRHLPPRGGKEKLEPGSSASPLVGEAVCGANATQTEGGYRRSSTVISLALASLFLTACGNNRPQGWLGYAEGDNTFISAPQPGWVAHLTVDRGTQVHRGQLLFTLDDTREQAARDQAAAAIPQMKAEIAQSKANLVLMKQNLARQQGLERQHAGVPSALDQAQSNFRQAQGALEQLQAQERQSEAVLASAQYTLSQRDIVSYVDGPVQDVYFRQGEYVPASTPVVSILPPKNIYVRFFVPETEYAKVHLGQRVRVTCDSCKPMDATITFIAQQEEFTPPVIFSVGNREKLVFKLEARASGGLPLHPGQPVEVRPLPDG